ncbi:Mitotic checkpoint protein BUB3 [Grifola frondosa]|uniref:Mitotic checkpoint protein BUB3 n=1 Tax=Grifola frondosa TaxID=5627 RepID=A0A1C7LL86_GRIFR|nr:Mitotic checkpoint protein BUB3 [Grifola frondosa]
MAEQIELNSPPFDSISAVRFSPTNPSQLLVSSWDTLYIPPGPAIFKPPSSSSPLICSTLLTQHIFQTVRFYDIAANEQKSKFDTGPPLNLETEKINHLGQHSDPISSMNFSRELNTLITGSWDRTLRFWDPRASSPQQASYDLPERVYNMDLVNYNLVVAMASRLFHFMIFGRWTLQHKQGK